MFYLYYRNITYIFVPTKKYIMRNTLEIKEQLEQLDLTLNRMIEGNCLMNEDDIKLINKSEETLCLLRLRVAKLNEKINTVTQLEKNINSARRRDIYKYNEVYINECSKIKEVLNFINYKYFDFSERFEVFSNSEFKALDVTREQFKSSYDEGLNQYDYLINLIDMNKIKILQNEYNKRLNR